MTDRSTPRFALPGKWGRIRLESEVATSRSICKMLDEAANRRDGLATYESEMLEFFDSIVRTTRWPAPALIPMEVSP